MWTCSHLGEKRAGNHIFCLIWFLIRTWEKQVRFGCGRKVLDTGYKPKPNCCGSPFQNVKPLQERHTSPAVSNGFHKKRLGMFRGKNAAFKYVKMQKSHAQISDKVIFSNVCTSCICAICSPYFSQPFNTALSCCNIFFSSCPQTHHE